MRTWQCLGDGDNLVLHVLGQPSPTRPSEILSDVLVCGCGEDEQQRLTPSEASKAVKSWRSLAPGPWPQCQGPSVAGRDRLRVVRVCSTKMESQPSFPTWGSGWFPRVNGEFTSEYFWFKNKIHLSAA